MRLLFIIIFLVLAIEYPVYSQDANLVSQKFIEQLSLQDYTSAYLFFDASLKAKLTESQFTSILKSLSGQYGNFSTLNNTRSTVVSDTVLKIESFCSFEKGGLIIQSAWHTKRNKIIGLFFRPDTGSGNYHIPNYAIPKSYIERDISFQKIGRKIMGTLTWPKNQSTSKLVILIAGSGAIDRDVTIGNNKPFKDIALGLASKGIASFRYDKVAYITHQMPKDFQDEYLSDIDYLIQVFSEKDSVSKIILLGHSLGATAAILSSSTNKKISKLIQMASSTRSMDELIIEQSNYLLKQPSLSQPDSIVLLSMRQSAQKVFMRKYDLSTKSQDLPLNMPASYWKSIQAINQKIVIKKLHIPILFLQGQRDYQVPLQDFNNWENHLSREKQVKFILYEKLNHLFFEGEGISTPKEYLTPSNVPAYVISDLTNWIAN